MIAYVIIAFWTFGHVVAHWCDDKTDDPWVASRPDLGTEREKCEDRNFSPPAGTISGLVWPVYWTGKFFVWWHKEE